MTAVCNFSKTPWYWSFLKRRCCALTSSMKSKAWNRAKRYFNMDLSPDELTPTEEHLVEVIAQLAEQIEPLKDELRRAKGETARPKIKPSLLNQPSPDGNRPRDKGKPKGKRKKRPGSTKRSKTPHLEIHETILLHPENRPPEARPVDYQDVVVQDLIIRSHTIKYRRARYRLPDGGFVIAPLPSHVDGHFGVELRCYVLYQYFQNHVTQPLIHEELLERGLVLHGVLRNIGIGTPSVSAGSRGLDGVFGRGHLERMARQNKHWAQRSGASRPRRPCGPACCITTC